MSICILYSFTILSFIVWAMPDNAIEFDIPYKYSGYSTQEKSLTDTEWDQGTAVIKTISFSKEREIIPDAASGTLKEMIKSYLMSPEFIAKIPMPPYGEWMGKKWNPSNASEYRVYKLYDTPIGALYVLDFQCDVDKEKSHESGIVSIFVIKSNQIFSLFTEEWGRWHSGEFTDKHFYGLVGNEIILREISVTGVRYVFYRYNGNQIEEIQEFFDEQTDANQYFNPD
jgi:hypothetical protein